ncbi:MAG TPA: cupin domain-containing protein [Saprospiraceae bacterium]|nr:cupin domain-containing protein [Saprospiraceae bacterium]
MNQQITPLTPLRHFQNPVTGHHFDILQDADSTHGALLDMEVTYPPQSVEPPTHYHPFQTEHFTILDGEMSIRINGQLRVYQAGESIEMPPNVHHAMWNSGHTPTRMHWRISPALQSEALFYSLATLAGEGKTDQQGKPSLLYAGILFHRFSREFRLSSPPYVVQKWLFKTLAHAGAWLGLKV